MSDLDARLLKAHETGDKFELVQLYSAAAHAAHSEDARAFYLTHAYIFALDTGHPDTSELKNKLIAMNRDTD